ncbi:MAG: ATP-binding cassette domain-containing protein [Streptosporangiales bacterium]|nr:ATP-binding cassette domain-containing protein [Streptosporangiales bacterium]
MNFQVPEAEFVCLLGPSGCGKTTLIRIAAGLVTADAGTVVLDDRVVTGPGTDRALVFQSYGLLPWRSVLRNVEFGLEISGMSKSERRAIAREKIKRVGLEGFESHFPHQISGGMQQRVGLARALVRDPSLLLMDEPFAAVDMQTRETLQEELLRVWTESKRTVMFVTHSIDEAIYLADRVIVMQANPGKIVEDITVDLPRPRFDYDVKATAEFGELRHRCREALGQRVPA